MRRHIRGLHEADQSAARSVRDGLLLVRVERAHHQWSSRKPFYLVRFSILDGQGFDCATWLHKARQMPKEEFRHEVEKELTGQDTEPVEIIYFKLYKSQVPVVEQAIGTAALMLGSDRSRGYCLEMICADFLAGANLDNQNPETLLFSMRRFFRFLSEEQQRMFLGSLNETA